MIYKILFSPKDEELFKNIRLMRLIFDPNNTQLKENNFYYEYRKLLNPDYHFLEEKFIIYTQDFNLIN